MRLLAILFLGTSSAVWYYFSWNYMANTMPELIIHSAFTEKNNTNMVLVFLAGLFVLGILFGKLLANNKTINIDPKIHQKKKRQWRFHDENRTSVKTKTESEIENKVREKNREKEKFTNGTDKESVKNLDTDNKKNINIFTDITDRNHSEYSIHRVEEKLFTKTTDWEKSKSTNNLDFQEEKQEKKPIIVSSIPKKTPKIDFYNMEENMGENAFANVAKKILKKKDFPTHSNKDKKENKDNLKIIEGIGPKIETLLNKGNIFSYNDLAQSNTPALEEILSKGGTQYALHNPKTWPKQALFAVDKKWGSLKEYQEKLVKGLEV